LAGGRLKSFGLKKNSTGGGVNQVNSANKVNPVHQSPPPFFLTV
jgi:hypothetical protein